ncbi:MAG: pyridoxal phosphate-dependent aminotransferase [Blastocatellia bacterium]|nr:pyridoxal phosphate-dependent aminotransferase [Blastocatellia bacterium]
MSWAKHHAGARYNLANSGILGCERGDLALTIEDLAVNGPNHEGYAPLKEAIATKYGTTPDRVMTAQGTSMANFLAMATVIERGDEVLIEHPVYDPLLAAAAYLGAEVKRFHRRFENDYQIDLDEMQSLLTPRTRLIVITSPHNPSGVAVAPAALRRIGEMAAAVGARVMIDEVYRDILFEDAPPSAVHLGPQFIATSSLTKSYGLSGLRCGWILCEPDLAERMQRLNDLFGAVGSMPSDSLAVAAFGQLARLEARTRAMIEANTALVRRFLREHEADLECVVPPRSMIVFPRLRRHEESGPLHDRLREFETSIVPGRFFEEPRHFRLGFAVKPEDVEIGLQNLSKTLRLIG